MRGVAAVAVLGLHAGFGFGLAYYPVHGALAVDFFFCLSGFVIAYAYDEKLRRGLSFAAFAKSRIIRLYPMIFLAGLIAVPAFYAGAWPTSTTAPACLALSGFTLVPLGLALNMAAYPLNVPIWSLFFEFFANALYFVTVRGNLSPAGLRVFVVSAGVILITIVYLVGAISNVGDASAISFLAGIPRVVFSFFLGVILSRLDLNRILPACSAWLVAAALALTLFAPTIALVWLYDCLALAVLPVLVALGSRVSVNGAAATLCARLGALSYPLYVIHEPILRAVYRFSRSRPALHTHPAITATFAAALAILLAEVALRIYDIPLRQRLAARKPLASAVQFADS